MIELVSDLIHEKQELKKAEFVVDEDDFHTALILSFEHKTLRLNAVVDRNTLELVAEQEAKAGENKIECHALKRVIGLPLTYAWMLENHQGIRDAFQVEFSKEIGEEKHTFQFLAMSGDIELLKVSLD